jgi:hypothetical protein
MRHYLDLHPQIGLHAEQEAHFFDNDSHFANADPDFSGYHANFPERSAGWRLGEVTPVLLFWEAAGERIQQYNPEIQMIAILRNPIDRAFSHWNMQRPRARASRAAASQSDRSDTLSPSESGAYSSYPRRCARRQLESPIPFGGGMLIPSGVAFTL